MAFSGFSTLFNFKRGLGALLGGVLLWPLVLNAGSPNICANEQARAFLNRRQSLRGLKELPALAGAAKLVLIGELHGGTPGARREILETLAGAWTAAGTCLFYELDRKAPIEDYLRKFSAPGYEESLREFQELHATAAALGLAEYTVDGSYPLVYDGSDLNPRDQMMAQRIRELFAQGLCGRAVMFVGSDHMVEGQAGRHPLPRILNLALYRVRLQEASDGQWKEAGADYRGLMSWRGLCHGSQQTLPAPAAPAVFQNSLLPPSLKLNPLSGESGLWSEFDATVLVTAETR